MRDNWDESEEMATEYDAMKEYARNAGSERPEDAWILTPYDVWERNPFYCGPEIPHPESYTDELVEDVCDECNTPCKECKCIEQGKAEALEYNFYAKNNEEVPF